MVDKTEDWNNYRTKDNPVSDIEYETKVTALCSMWKVHKTLYGVECN